MAEQANNAGMAAKVVRLIADARRSGGLTQAAVAETMGVARSYISQLEDRDVDRQLGTLHRYAAAVGVPLTITVGSRTLTTGDPLVAAVDWLAADPDDHDQLQAVRRTGRIYPPGYEATILTAELVTASATVADRLGVTAGEPVICRRRLVRHNRAPVSLSTSWFDGQLADTCPLLLSRTRIPQGTWRYIEQATGRQVVCCRQQLVADFPNSREAANLQLAGDLTPVLRRRSWYHDNRGSVVEYGVSATAGTVTYEHHSPHPPPAVTPPGTTS